eukprot:jgi/Tetstr1/421717/TSEL_012655.t1
MARRENCARCVLAISANQPAASEFCLQCGKSTTPAALTNVREGVDSVGVFHDVHGGPLKVRNHRRHAKKARAEARAELHVKRGAHGGVRMTDRGDIVPTLYPLSLEVKEKPFRGHGSKLKVVKGTVYFHTGVVAAKEDTDLELLSGPK